MLDDIQREAFTYFLDETNLANGLVFDTTSGHAPASIATVGLALTAYPVAVARGLISRADAAQRTLTTLRFFWESKQGPEPDATGYHGFYYHFLDMKTGARVWESELSTVDSALLIAGMLVAAAFFDDEQAAEREIRDLADRLYARADWHWAQNGGTTLTHGWTPEGGFLPYRWQGYDEAMVLYVLALGSSTRLPPTAIRRGAPPTSGERCTTRRTSTPGRCSRTSCPTSGSISGAFGTRSCRRTTATTSRTAGGPRSCSDSTPFRIPATAPSMGSGAGGSRRVRGRGT